MSALEEIIGGNSLQDHRDMGCGLRGIKDTFIHNSAHLLQTGPSV